MTQPEGLFWLFGPPSRLKTETYQPLGGKKTPKGFLHLQKKQANSLKQAKT